MNMEHDLLEQLQVDTSGKRRRLTAEDLLRTRPKAVHFARRPEDEDEICPPLFDRSERTRAAAFTKGGNAVYSTPTQRIGAYMDFAANLKRSQLMDIISYLKTTGRKCFSIIDKSTPMQYLDTSLFHGYMKEEAEVSQQLYDPVEKEGKELEEYRKPWAEELATAVSQSQKRYLHYITREEFCPDEIALYNKQWMKQILSKLGEQLLKAAAESTIGSLYQDVVDSFALSMKRAIVNYILRSPVERKRLRISTMPRTVVASSEMIAYAGGYNIAAQSEWHSDKCCAVENVRANLLVNNVVMSALQNWFQDFRAIQLLHFKSLSLSKGPAITVTDFFELEKRYRRKVKGLFKHIWYRGAILILYKFKYLKRSGWGPGKFTLSRYIPLSPSDCTDENADSNYLDNVKGSPMDQRLGPEYAASATIDEVWSSLVLEKEELEDIRSSEAYQSYARRLKGNVDYEEDGYKLLSKEFRSELKYGAGNLMRLQMREIIERALELVKKYFKPFDTARVVKLDLNSLKEIGKMCKSGDKEVNLNELQTVLGKVLKQAHAGTVPIWRVRMEVKNGRVQFHESEDFVIFGMIELIDKVSSTFDKFLHPDFARAKFLSKKQLEEVLQLQRNKEQMFTHLNDVKELKRVEQNMYLKYCANIKIMESKKQSKMLQSVAENKVFFNKRIDRTFNIGEFMRSSSGVPGSKCANYRLHIQNTISKFYQEASQLLKLFAPFKRIISKQILVDYAAFTAKEPIVLEEYRECVGRIDKYAEIIGEVPKVLFMTMFEVDCTEVITHIKTTLNEAKLMLKDKMEETYMSKCGDILESYSKAADVLRTPMTSPGEVQFIEAFKCSLILDTASWKEDAYRASKVLFALLDADLIPSERTVLTAAKLHSWPHTLRLIAEEVDEPHRVQREQQEKLLRQRRAAFEADSSQFAKKIPVLETFREIKDCKKVMEAISVLEAQLNHLNEQRRTINEHEKLLFDFETPFDAFNKVNDEFAPYFELWKSVEAFDTRLQHWFQSRLSDLDLAEMERQLKDHARTLRRAQKFFAKKTRPAGYGVTQTFGKEVEEMQRALPVVEILTAPGLRGRHWEEVQKVLDVPFEWKNATVKNLISKGVEVHKEKLMEISDVAGKEYILEKSLEKMKKEWERQEFLVVSKDDRGLKLLSGARVEEMQQLLDEHIVTAQQIRANPFVVPVEEEASAWEDKLLNLREVLDKWIAVQLDYLYLHPIFDSEDIIKRLPEEAEKFAQVKGIWDSLIESVSTNKKAICVDKALILYLDEAQAKLEGITSNLNNYLEDKRKKFPRLYFLANDDMYDMLREVRNPRKVVVYLKKLFEGISDLVFAQNLDITGMRSREGEQVGFVRKVLPEEYHGSIEAMLLDIEREMRSSVAKEVERAFKNYTENVADWLAKGWASQAVLAVSQLVWCQKIGECFSRKALKELGSYLAVCELQLKDCVKLIRQTIPKLQQITISSLIVLYVHSNDILESLIANKVTSETSFEWISQLRYYYDSFSTVRDK